MWAIKRFDMLLVKCFVGLGVLCVDGVVWGCGCGVEVSMVVYGGGGFLGDCWGLVWACWGFGGGCGEAIGCATW